MYIYTRSTLQLHYACIHTCTRYLTTAANVFQGLFVSLEVLVNSISLVVQRQSAELIQEWKILFGVLDIESVSV